MQISQISTLPKLEWHLGDSGMTLLHRAGLAGLWMTLEQLETVTARPGELRWKLTPRSISMQWEGNDFEVLNWLLRESFQVNKDGLITLTGLNPNSLDIQTQVTIHQGIRGTFLQHPSTYKASGLTSKSLQIDENSPEVIVKYQMLTSYAHQDFAKSLCDQQGRLLEGPVSVAGWLNPGAVVRHVAFSGQTSFEETPAQALALLFAPVACQYFVLRSVLRDKRAQYAVVVPEVTDMAVYTRRRSQFSTFGYKDFYASGLGDAALRFLTFKETVDVVRKNKVERCQVLTLGTVAWSSQQRTRTNLHTVVADEQICNTYKLAERLFASKTLPGKEGGFIVPSFAREIFAENLATGKPWYAEFSEHLRSGELFKKITYERNGLNQMVQQAQWDDQTEQLFVMACHEALFRRGGKLKYEAAKRGEIPNYDRLTEEVRTGLARCKNADTFREFITDFWSRAGSVPTLQEHWSAIIKLINDQRRWRVAKDLALLALASYKPPAKMQTELTTEEEME